MMGSKKTKLHPLHTAAGAQMANFSGYEMPLWYAAGAKAENLAVINAVGLFDTSHMAAVLVAGPAARSLMQWCFSKDLDHFLGRGRGLVDGRCVYGVFLADDGTVIDDAIVYQLAGDRFLVVINAAMGPVVAAHLDKFSVGTDVEVTDLTGHFGKVDVQGPQSLSLLWKVVKNPQAVFAAMPFFSFTGGFAPVTEGSSVELHGSLPVLISRTGYTGEFGFELYCAPEHLVPMWERLLDAGAEYGALPCGLAARDSLRTGAMLPLSHQDIGPWPFVNNPWQFALPWSDDGTRFTKEFAGGEALLATDWSSHTYGFAGFDPRKISNGPRSSVLDARGRPVGSVLSCTTDMAIDRDRDDIFSVATRPESRVRGLCCGFVLVKRECQIGEHLWLADTRRKIKVEIRTDIRPARTARYSFVKMKEKRG